jgi:membrane protein involved in colicin uptake
VDIQDRLQAEELTALPASHGATAKWTVALCEAVRLKRSADDERSTLIPTTGEAMSSFMSPDLEKRQSAAAAAKKALLERFRAASEDPRIAEKQAERAAIVAAREKRMAEREAAKRAREAEQAAEAARLAEAERLARIEEEKLQALIEAEKAEAEARLLAEQKAARDARYAARKAAKKVRRRGY